MGKQRKKYTQGFKDEIIEKVKTSGKPVSQIADSYGINPNLVYKWITGRGTRDPNILRINRLERERAELLQIIGELTQDLSREKKESYRLKLQTDED
jgi:transposase-like protein